MQPVTTVMGRIFGMDRTVLTFPLYPDVKRTQSTFKFCKISKILLTLRYAWNDIKNLDNVLHDCASTLRMGGPGETKRCF